MYGFRICCMFHVCVKYVIVYVTHLYNVSYVVYLIHIVHSITGGLSCSLKELKKKKGLCSSLPLEELCGRAGPAGRWQRRLSQRGACGGAAAV